MVTGHRPERLGDKATSVAVWLDSQLRELKPTIAISGMAAGTDQIFAELALKQHISLAAALPWKKDWDKYHPVVQKMLEQADEVVYAYDHYDKRGYVARDRIMVDAADIVLAVWDGNEWGGTWDTIAYARKKGKTIYYFPWISSQPAALNCQIEEDSVGK